MMSDWCQMVIFWLNGNDINKEIELILNSIEGYEFFKGIKDIKDMY